MSKRRGETSTTAEDTLIGLPTGVDSATDYGKSPRGGRFHQVDYNAMNNAYQHDGENREITTYAYQGGSIPHHDADSV
ncbi:hypothetical protein DICA1_E17700 [Diutina catenulata]